MIKNLPLSERPREKAWLNGIESLGNEELLAIIINSGVKGHSALDIAKLLLANGLKELPKKEIPELRQIKGISLHKSLLLISVFELLKRYERAKMDIKQKFSNADDIVQHIRLAYASNNRERLLLIILNSHNQIRQEVILSLGTHDAVEIDQSTLFSYVLRQGAKRFILVHNHPDGDSRPSSTDIETTQEIKVAARLLNITFVDHIIVAEDGYYSFVQNHIM